MAIEPCPECGSSDRKQEPGEYALMALTGERRAGGAHVLQIDPNTANHTAVVVQATVCQGCGHVALYEAA
jgi:hypothetical protein